MLRAYSERMFLIAMSLESRIAKQRAANELARLRREAREVVLRSKRIPSLSEQKACYHPPGYGLFFCPHDKHYFTECTACKRTFKDGQENMKRFLSKQASEQPTNT
jgi:hypothetical protein